MPRSRSFLLLGVVAAACIAGALFLTAPARAGEPSPLEVRGVEQLSPRLSELRVFSPAMGREVRARVLVPSGFDPARDHLPVLWLLHGGFGQASDWTVTGQAEELTAGLPLIVVMPDAGIGGWYADWRAATPEGSQRWETFHLDELRPFVEARYATRTDRAGRAVAGLSMGGFGAMHYAARHPDLFGFAASFSGAVDNLHPGVSAVVLASPLAHQGRPGDVFGDRVLDETRWRANNPVDLAANLRTVGVQLRTGNGMPGGPHGGAPDIQEGGVSQATATLHQRLDELGIAHLYDDYGPGAHTWEYWVDALRATLPGVLATTAERRPDPATVDHVAFEPSFSVWGFDVALERPVLEAATLSIRPDGFDLQASGAGVVLTPPRYAAGQQVRVTATADGGAVSVSTLVADGLGRVRVPVDLGPASPTDEFPLAAVLPARKATVRIVLETPPVAVQGVVQARQDPGEILPATGGSGSGWIGCVLALAALVGLRNSRGLASATCQAGTHGSNRGGAGRGHQ